MTETSPRRAPRHRQRWSLRRAIRRPELLVAGVVVVAAVVGNSAGRMGFDDDAMQMAAGSGAPTGEVTLIGGDDAEADAQRARAAEAQSPQPSIAAGPAEGTTPVRVMVPSIGIDAALDDLNQRNDGVLEPPTGLQNAGWYTGSSVPGAVGPSVIAGHVDDTEQAGVFARLRELAPGAEITVQLSDGTEQHFVVDGSIDVAKAAFPTEAVYGATRDAQLRLITCNGPYDFGVHHYSNNLVVFASAISADAVS